MKMSPYLASLLLFAMSSPPADTLRQSLAAHSDRMFFWLLVSSAVTGLGVIFEAPGEVRELKRWWKLKRLGKAVGYWIPVTFIGLTLVISGIIGEGVFEFLSADAETALRAHDEQVLGDTIIQAGEAKDSAKAAATDATIAKGASAGAVTASGTALTLATGARKEADTFEANIVSARKEASDTHEWLRQFLLFRRPRAELVGTSPGLGFVDENGSEFAKAMSPFAGQKIEMRQNLAQIPDPSEQEEIKGLMNSIEVVLGFNAQWKPSLGEGISGNGEGVAVGVAANATEETKRAAQALANELGSRLVTDEFGRTPHVFIVKWHYRPPDADTVVLYVGKHP